MAKPTTVEEVDEALEKCRQTLEQLKVRSSRLIVWTEIDTLLDRRKILARQERKEARLVTDRAGR